MDQSKPASRLVEMDKLLDVMARLRDPKHGCPWDVEQSFETIAPYTIEEAYEVEEAIRDGDRAALKDELGDLLFQVVFHAQMADEEGTFTFSDVAGAIVEKMIRRHPHVFAEAEARTSAAQTVAWEEQKAAERAAKADENSAGGQQSALDGVALGLPALLRAEKLQKRAGRVGFDWPGPAEVLEKIEEEAAEVREAMSAESDGNNPSSHLAEEVGDLLFACANLARKLGLNPETTLRNANAKFERRFRELERRVRSHGSAVEGATLDALDAVWEAVKADEAGRDNI